MTRRSLALPITLAAAGIGLLAACCLAGSFLFAAIGGIQ